eukprot:174358_1
MMNWIPFVIDLYICYMKKQWWLHLVLDGWLQISVLMLLLWCTCTLKKQKTLQKNGKLTKGLVIDKYECEDKYEDEYIIKYIFSDHNETTRILLIHGYTNKNTDSHIPTSIIHIISKFHGLGTSTYDYSSIIDQQTIGKKDWLTVEIGDKIDLLFDPNHPQMLNKPTMLIKNRSKEHVIIWMCTIVFISLLLIWYYSWAKHELPTDTTIISTIIVTILIFLTYFINSLIIVSIFYGFYMLYQFCIHWQMNSYFAHEKYRQVYDDDDKDDETEYEGEDTVICMTL